MNYIPTAAAAPTAFHEIKIDTLDICVSDAVQFYTKLHDPVF